MKFDVVSVGEALIDFVSTERDLTLADAGAFRRAAGGSPANVAVGLARLDAKVAFVGKIGKDAFGDHIINTFQQNNIDTSGLVQDEMVDTTLVFVNLNDKSVPEFFFFRHGTADTALKAEELPQPVLTDTLVLHFSSVSLSVEPARSASLTAVDIARRSGAFVSFDPNIRLSLWSDAERCRQEIMAVIPQVDVLKMNEAEWTFLTGKSVELLSQESATEFFAMGVRVLAVTCGEKGSVLVSPDGLVRCAALPVDVVDTTGAGDAFMAGMLSVICESIRSGDKLCRFDCVRLETMGRWGNVTAALSCTKSGGIPSLPDRKQVVNLLLML